MACDDTGDEAIVQVRRARRGGSLAAGARSAGGPPSADPDAFASALLSAGEMRAAAEEVIRAHGGRIRQYLLSLLREPDLADDAFSIWSEWTLNGIGRYEGRASLRTWAFGVAHNAARRVRDDTFQRRRCSLSRAGVSRAAAGRASSQLRREHELRVVDVVRAGLSLDDQALLALRVAHRLPWRSIAAVLSSDEPVTPAALRKRFQRLKDRIRELARHAGETG
ncbi:MAG TPA: sigma-70 family RNA polymerase sigma factor [Anaeromyxobacter sp.]|nr:sigma-70 family RNA polymerase sigma factor [Anaeromyxobacter sp.]